MRRICFIAISLLLLTSALFAQEEAWYQGKPIVDVRFEGLTSVSRSELEGITEQFIGRNFTDSVFLDLQRRLYALDYFQQIVPRAVRAQDGEAVVIVFEVDERPLVRDVVFEGSRSLREGELRDAIVLKPGDIVTGSKVRLDEQAVEDTYVSEGFPNVQVTGEVEEIEGANEVNVVFRIDEGARVTIEEIRFSGNTFASDSTLRGVMESKAQSIFNRGTFQESTLEQDRQAIEQYYRTRGFIDAEVVEIDRERRQDEEDERVNLTLTIFVEEGEQYVFGGVDFEGNELFTDAELRERISLEPGDTLDMNRFESDFQQVADLYYRNGYIFNSISRQEERDEEENSVSFTVDIVERSRAHIENILIRGNEKTKDYVIRRELPLEVGDVFSASEIREGVRNLSNLQYFSNITPETPEGSVEGLMDLVINVEEANTADIRFGISFGAQEGFPVTGQLSWQDRNFLGRGQSIGAQLNVSPQEQQLGFNFGERWLFGRRWSAGVNANVDREIQDDIPQDVLAPIFGEGDANAVPDPFTGAYVFEEETELDEGSCTGETFEAGRQWPAECGAPTSDQIDEFLVTDYEYAGGDLSAIPEAYLMDYTDWEISLGGNTGYRFPTGIGTFAARTSVRTAAGFASYDAATQRPFDPRVRENLETWNFQNSWTLGLSLDDRDLVASPSSGYHADQSATFTGGFLFGDRHFIRTKSKGQLFWTFFDWDVFDNWSWKLVGGLNSELSFILPQFWVPADDRQDEFASGAQVAALSDLLALDGMTMARGWPFDSGNEVLWGNWFELRTPIAEDIVWFDQFFDAAAVWNERDDFRSLGIEDFKFSFGTGLRFTVPQFPIRLYLAKRFQIRDGKVDWQEGSLLNPNDTETGGIDFVLSFSTDFLGSGGGE
ncbi:MAG: outer membrane protein assembly factor BamA [Spirochaetaceae bacterium]